MLRVFGYGYDETGRVAAMTRNGSLEVAHTYDANGDRLAPNGVGLHSTRRGQAERRKPGAESLRAHAVATRVPA